MNTAGHYGVTNNSDHIKNLYCKHCDFIVWRPLYRVGKSRSGMGKYNRMRGEMVKHLHAEHRHLLSDKKGNQQ